MAVEQSIDPVGSSLRGPLSVNLAANPNLLGTNDLGFHALRNSHGDALGTLFAFAGPGAGTKSTRSDTGRLARDRCTVTAEMRAGS